MANKKPFDFEKNLDQLNQIVEKLDNGDQPLDKALADFEAGIKLTRECQQALTNAQQKVKILLDSNPNATLMDYEDSE